MEYQVKAEIGKEKIEGKMEIQELLKKMERMVIEHGNQKEKNC